MLFLLLTIGCSVTMALLVKQAENAGLNSVVFIAANYVSGSVVGWLLIGLDGGTTVSAETVGLGLVGGLLWPLPFFILARTIRELGVAIAAPLARFGLIIPVSFGVLFLGEQMTLKVGLGLVGALAAILLISPIQLQSVKGANTRALWLIPIMIVMIGTANMWVLLFNSVGDSAETNLFFTLIFSFASLFTFIVIWLRKIKVERMAIMRGALIGVFNFCYTYFLLLALRAPIFIDNSAIVYTLANVGIMLLVFAAGILIWRETVTRRNVFGVGVAVAALLLLNLR